MKVKKRVLLGMSGGVDSSVAAIILKEQGYDVIGITMKMFDEENDGSCCNISSILDAKKICNYLQIPHYTLNLKKEFNVHVINDFIDCYLNCKTPNPCIECNKYLKFDAMYKRALELECDYIATGHYAKIEYDLRFKTKVLKIADNINKDQSYVLYGIKKEILDKVLFPIGTFKSKIDVRKIAQKHNLTVANKPDSEDICFIPDGNYKNFLEKHLDTSSLKGNIVNRNKEVLGAHAGLYKYTIGQRKGLGITNKEPLFVTGFNNERNELIVGTNNELYKKEFLVSDTNWLLFENLIEPLDVNVKIRYSSKFYKATIFPCNNYTKVVLNAPQRAITPGQSAVFYINDIVVGGGKIFFNNKMDIKN